MLIGLIQDEIAFQKLPSTHQWCASSFWLKMQQGQLGNRPMGLTLLKKSGLLSFQFNIQGGPKVLSPEKFLRCLRLNLDKIQCMIFRLLPSQAFKSYMVLKN